MLCNFEKQLMTSERIKVRACRACDCGRGSERMLALMGDNGLSHIGFSTFVYVNRGRVGFPSGSEAGYQASIETVFYTSKQQRSFVPTRGGVPMLVLVVVVVKSC